MSLGILGLVAAIGPVLLAVVRDPGESRGQPFGVGFMRALLVRIECEIDALVNQPIARREA